MTNFTIYIYRFFQRHRILFYLTLISSSLFFVYFGSKVEYEEDLAKLLPSNELRSSEKVVFANLKVKDKLFVLFTAEAGSIYPEELAMVCDSFIASLLARDAAQEQRLIKDALYKINDDLIQNSIEFLYNHIPLFLDSADYVKMDSILTKESIEDQMADNLMILMSPSGTEFGEIIRKDPVGFRDIFTEKMGQLKEGFGENYILHNNHFFTPDTAIGVAFISPDFQAFNSKESSKLILMLEEEIAQFKNSFPEVKISYHGPPAQSMYNSKQIKKDLVMTLSGSLLVICLIILYCFRNKSSLLYLLMPVVYGTFFSLTVIYFIKSSVALVAMGIGAVVLGVALSYCLHILTHYKYVNDPVKVLQAQTVPTLLACFTTIGAFASLLFTQSELLRDFGMFASLALVGTTFFCIIFLPHFFNPEKNRRSDKAFAFLEKINAYPLEKQKGLIIGVVVLSGICFYTSRWVTFDTNLQNIGHYEEKVNESRELLIAHTTPDHRTFYYAATSENLDSAFIYNKQLILLMDSLLQKGKILSFSQSSSLFIPTSEQQERIDKWNAYWNRERKEQIEQDVMDAAAIYSFKPEMFQPFFQALDKDYEPVFIYDSEIMPPAILDNMIEYTDSIYLVFTPVQLKPENMTEVSDVLSKSKNAVVVEHFYYTKDMVRLLNDDFNLILGASSLFVFIVLLISYRSLLLAVLAFLPMALSWYIVLGVMGIFGMQFNLINIIVATFIFGIGDDYSIFIMDGSLARFRTKSQLLTYHKTAIFLSTVVLIVGVASLMFAAHPAISSVGLSTLIGMVTTCVIAYSLQPFLFYWLIKHPTSKGKAPITLYNLLYARSYFGKKGFSDIQKIRNNYAYKGISVEKSLRDELKKTNGYAIFEPYIKEQKRVLEYGCQYGFIAYWFMLKGKNNDVTGYNSDSEAVAIAENCYLKNERIRFISDKNFLSNEKYDVLILNRITHSDKENIQQLIPQTSTVIFRAEYFSQIKEIIPSGFSEVPVKENTPSLFRIYLRCV